MNWQAVNFDWNQIRAFLATAEEGSLSAAARVLGQTQPTLGRQVAALEEELGVVLFERVGKTLSLTPAGREIVKHVKGMRDAAHKVSLAATGHAQDISGSVRITASDIFSATILPAAVAAIREAAPRLTVEVIANNTIQDLQRREADIAIRHIRPTEPELTARLLQEATAYFYAAPNYIQRYGHPRKLTDTPNHVFIAFGDIPQMAGYMKAMGLEIDESQYAISSENGIVAWEMTRMGLGISPMSEVVGQGSGMTQVFDEVPPITFPIWLTTHRELHTSRRIRLVYDILAEHFSARSKGHAP